MNAAQPHLVDALAASASNRPDSVFCHLRRRSEWSTTTWADLATRSAAFAEGYLRRGVEPRDTILVVLEHGTDLFPAFLGAMLIGSVPAFLPFPSSKQDPRRFWRAHVPLFERTTPKAVVTWQENGQALSAEIGMPLTCMVPEEFDRAGDFDRVYQAFHFEPDAAAFLQHSSGTTGIKKGVEVSHRAMCAHLSALKRAVGIESEDRIATWLPVYHDMGLVGCFLLPVHAGIPIVALDPFEWVTRPYLILDAIQRHRCTHTWWPNFAFQHVCKTHDENTHWELGTMKAYLNTSEPCKPKAFQQFLDTFGKFGVTREQLQVSYGMAEMVFLMTMTELGKPVGACRVDDNALLGKGVAIDPPLGSAGIEVISCGRPLDGVHYEIVDPEGNDLRDDCVGEVVAWGDGLFSGYFRNYAETTRKLRNGKYFTGDLAFRRDGQLYVMGRKDDRIIVCGKNFFAHDIELVAGSVSGVKGGRVAVFGVFSEDTGSEEVVVVAESTMPAAEWTSIANDVRLAIIDELNLSPRDVRIVAPGWIVKTTSGKMSRHDNYRKYLDEVLAMTGENTI